mmetsp:Transcript_22520/g.49065  ORF Transcript_22520/g.49065 Transcript_22520/m.49065 type:complete len:234 (+) Transcript_22520:2172-2873(+)
MAVAMVEAYATTMAIPPSSPNSCLKVDSTLEISPRTDICLSARPLRRFNWATARSVTSRASGSEILAAFCSKAGKRRGRKGAASSGLSTSLLMLLIMTADWRLVAICFSRKPRNNKGTTMARAGDSTVWTNVTPAILCMISGTSFGSVMATRIFSVMCSISRLPTTSRAAFMASLAASFTCFLVSHIHAVTSGTTSGRASPSCLGASFPNIARSLSVRARICHLISTWRLGKI